MRSVTQRERQLDIMTAIIVILLVTVVVVAAVLRVRFGCRSGGSDECGVMSDE